MDLDLNNDQKELQAAVHRIALPFASAPASNASYFLDGSPLYRELEEAGFIRAAKMEEYGALGGVLIAEITSALPYSAATAGAALIAPMAIGAELKGPVAIARAGHTSAVRHLPFAKMLLVVGDDEVRALDLADVEVQKLPSIFADPFGGVSAKDIQGARKLQNASPSDVVKWWNVAVAAEIGGAAGAAVERTVEFVKIRRQFGRPIGSYQAIQHRLAECEVMVNATRMLARCAAVTGDPAAAFLASSYAQATASRIAYDTQQFHGAAGLTREIELHFFTYRLRSLQGELAALGGPGSNPADLLWPTADAQQSGPKQASVL